VAVARYEAKETIVKRSRISGVGAILVLLTLVGVCNALTMRSARAATVFSNTTGVNCKCGFGSAFYAEEFSPSSDFDFTIAAAFVDNTDIEAQSFSMGLYSSLPGSPLWTSGTLTAPAKSATLVSASNTGSPILLQTGMEYFLVLNLSGDSPNWLGQGSSSVPAFTSTEGSSWDSLGEQNLQFEVFGTAPGAAIPEPASWAMLLLGFGLLGLVANIRGLVAFDPTKAVARGRSRPAAKSAGYASGVGTRKRPSTPTARSSAS
jgi:PEP-CTERM motif